MCDTSSDTYDVGDFIVVQYMCKGRSDLVYYAAMITEVDEEEEMYKVSFYKKKGKQYFLFDEDDDDEIGAGCI